MYFIVLSLVLVGFGIYWKQQSKKTVRKIVDVPAKWKSFLMQKVLFYRGLTPEQKHRFELDIYNFLQVVRITGVEVEVTLEDRLLVASSAVIPIFGFPEWTYKYLDEVLLYPGPFDRSFHVGNPNEVITGMVGNGPMEGKMILSKPSLHAGFEIGNDKRNVGIHEFVHLFDKEDGEIDGIPPGFHDKAHVVPWLEFIRQKTKEIEEHHSDIDEYAATKKEEFFAVASEYFFERPHLLQEKHPQLYAYLSEIFNQDTAKYFNENSSTKIEIGRNDPCPCGSGMKYKKCCLK